MSSNPEEPQYREPVEEPEDTSDEEEEGSEEECTDDEQPENPEEPTVKQTGPIVEPEEQPEDLPPVDDNLSELLEELGLVDEEEPVDEPVEPNTNEKEPVDEPVEPNPDDELPEEFTTDNKSSDEEMANTTSPKSLVPDPGFFDGTRSKFEDWWRAMKLFMKFNKIKTTNDKAIAVLSCLRGGTAGAFATMKTAEVVDGEDTLDWGAFAEEFRKTFSDNAMNSKAEWQIEKLKQGTKNTADFLIEFDVLANKAKTDAKHCMFLLKKNVRSDIIHTIMGYPPAARPDTYKEWREAILSMGQGYEATGYRGDKRSSTGVTYGGAGEPMEIGQQHHIFNDKGEPKCYNCGIFGHIAKNCKKPKNTTCYNCGKPGHFAKNCRAPKKSYIQAVESKENSDNEEQQDFSEDSE